MKKRSRNNVSKKLFIFPIKNFPKRLYFEVKNIEKLYTLFPKLKALLKSLNGLFLISTSRNKLIYIKNNIHRIELENASSIFMNLFDIPFQNIIF